jgi:hypothetical protein
MPQPPRIGGASLKSTALIVLLVFGGLLGLQAACTAGWLPHCLHDEADLHHDEACPEDTCHADFRAPVQGEGKSTLVKSAPLTASRLESALPPSRADSCPPWQPFVSRSPRPAGQFPLLI